MVIVETRVPTEENAVKMIRTAIERNLAVGGSIHKSREIYEWGSEIKDHDMFVTQITTSADNLQSTVDLVKELNDDKEPSIVFNAMAADTFTEDAANNNGYTKVTGKVYGRASRDM